MATETIAYVAVSVDGYIAGEGGTVTFLEEFGSEEYDFHGFLDSIGAVVMGSTTYEQIAGWGWPYGDRPGLVLTHRDLPVAEGASIEFSSAPTGEAIQAFADNTDTRLWIVGGGRVILDAMHDGVVDLLELYVMPVVLGAGVPLFPGEFQGRLTLLEATSFGNGVVRLRYQPSSLPG